MRHRHPLIVLPLALSLLAGCGTTPQDRAVSGAGIGAGTGAVLGALTGMSVLTGAALGAAGGGLTGVLTDDSQVDLGDPAWKRTSGSASDRRVYRVQAGLAALGYDPGPVDGALGPRTRAAIRAYQRDHGLHVDGRPSRQLIAHIEGGAG